MIDSNETLAYQNGRDAGYDDGYEDGAIMFAEYLKENSFLYDPNDSFSFQAIDVDDIKDLLTDFLENR